MSDNLDLFESELNSEFALSLEACNAQEILDCFAKCNQSEESQLNCCDSQLADEEIGFNLNNVNDELCLFETKNEILLLNNRQAFLANHKDTKEEIKEEIEQETKEKAKESNLVLDIDQKSAFNSTKRRSRDYSLANISNKIDSKSSKCRWSKQEDINLFKVFNDICQRFNIDKSLMQFSKGKVSKLHRNFFQSLKMEVGWRGTLVELKDRIIKIRSADKFTAREIRVLKRYLLKLADGAVCIEQVLEQFPGKTIEQINEFQNNN